ncbi:hypothetical protein AAG906_023921 [Vitis piasezkii]
MELVKGKIVGGLNFAVNPAIVVDWKEGGRVFKLELRSNNAGRFLHCSGVEGGWKTLARKLRSIGVVPAKISSKLPQGNGVSADEAPDLGTLSLWSLGCCSIEGKRLTLDWWSPKVGCLKEGALVKETWVRVLGLPLHLRGMEFFKRVGDACGGFVGVEVPTAEK